MAPHIIGTNSSSLNFDDIRGHISYLHVLVLLLQGSTSICESKFSFLIMKALNVSFACPDEDTSGMQLALKSKE